MSRKSMKERDLFEDILTNQKYITETYNTFANVFSGLTKS